MSSVEPEPPGAEAAHEPATIVTFYSYKGGVGRTMALANVAWILAGQGCRVLVVDWDLESPGLHRFLRPFLNDPELARTPGVVDMVQGYGRGVLNLVEAEGLDEAEFERRLQELLQQHTDVLQHRDTLRWSHFQPPGSIEFLGPGVQNESYSTDVALFDWASFYQQHRGKQFVQTLRERLRQGPYDYVLIDSRTGHSDNASICTLWLPDVVVAGFNLSNQSIEGTASVARQVHQQARETQRDIRILPVPMRVEHFDPSKGRRRRSYIQGRFAGLVGPLTRGSLEEYWGQVEVLHNPAFAYEEVLVPFTLLPGSASPQLTAYVRIAEEISRGRVTEARPVKENIRLQFADRFAEVRTSDRRTARIVYAPRDRQWADWIRSVLARVGISCETAGDWRAETGRASAKPTFTILVVSPALQSEPALDAVIDQHLRDGGRLGSGERTGSIVPVRVEEALVRPPIADLRGPRLQELDEADAQALLLAHFAQGEQPAEQRNQPSDRSSGGARFPGRTPRLWNNIPQRNAIFQGRETHIGLLRDGFPPGRPAMPAVLTGPLGVGKSQIALEFAYRFAADYDAIRWIRADSAENVAVELAGFGEELGVTKATAPGAVQDTLRALAGGHADYHRFLLVYDNVRRPSDLEGLLPSGGSSHVLITSETDDWSVTGRQHEVGVPTEDEARGQLRRHFPGLRDKQADDILAVSGRLPQTVEQAAAWLKASGLPRREAADRYREAMCNQSAGAGPRRAAPGRGAGYPAAAHATWSVSMESLRVARPVAEGFLRLLAHMAPNGVSIDGKTDVLRCQAALEWLSSLGSDPLTATTAGLAFRALSERALARVDYGTKRVVGDPMGLTFLRSGLSDAEFQESRRAAQRILASLSPRDTEVDDPTHAPVFAELDQHVDPSGAVHSDDDEVRRWLVNQVRYRRLARRLDSAQSLAERLRDKWNERHGPVERTDDVLLLRLNVELGNIHRDAGRFVESEEINRRALERLRTTLGLDHPYTLRSATGRGAELRALGHVQEAFAEDQSTADILTEVFGPDNPYTLMATGNLALSLAMVGMTAEALDLHRETYERCRGVLGVEHEMTWSAATQLGIRYRESGDYETSLLLLRQAFNEAEKRFGEADPATLRAARGLAATLRRTACDDLDQIGAARKYDSDAVAGWLSYAGPGHHEQLAGQLALAADLRLLGEGREACRLAEDALERFESWGEDHPFRRISQVNLALCRRSAGRVDGALELSEAGWRGLCETLGSDHPLTLIAALDHANALVFSGESTEALEMDRRTYERLSVRCGAEHPLTGFAATNLQDSEARVRDTGAAPGAERIEIDIDLPYI